MKLMIGNEAIARGAFEAGVTVVASYPGTPSTEITEFTSMYPEIYCEWSANEKVSVEVSYGASLGGARALSAMKHVGLNVAADPLFSASYTGVNGGLVIVVADDSGMHSSQNEQDSRYYAIFSKVPMLEPSDSQECIDFMKEAYEMSEKFDTPVLVRLTTRTAHSQSLVKLNDRTDIKLKGFDKNPQKYVLVPANARKKHPIVEERLKKVSQYSESSFLNKIEYDSKKIGVITTGIAYMYVKEALPDASVLKIGLINPLPYKIIEEFSKNVEKLYIIEELEPIIENHVKKIGIECIGKELFSVIGELSPSIIREKVLGVKSFESLIDNSNIPSRPPVLCPGCPHRGLHLALKGLKVFNMGDIGCYTLGYLPPTQTIDACLCMGASIGMAHGIEKAYKVNNEEHKSVALLGDSTFIHSGMTGLANLAYNKGTSTVIIADNSITGMTGHQHNPTTGYTIKEEETVKIDLVNLVHALGIKRVKVVDPFKVSELRKTVQEELSIDEPSVIITQRPCVLLEKNSKKKSYRIDASSCKRCKRCISTGCPAIEELNGTLSINETLCAGCSLCASFCNFGALKEGGC